MFLRYRISVVLGRTFYERITLEPVRALSLPEVVIKHNDTVNALNKIKKTISRDLEINYNIATQYERNQLKFFYDNAFLKLCYRNITSHHRKYSRIKRFCKLFKSFWNTFIFTVDKSFERVRHGRISYKSFLQQCRTMTIYTSILILTLYVHKILLR